ncbi:MAG: Nif3-like dinuclear metal center hexameric protein [Chryseosolibacter sp.]
MVSRLGWEKYAAGSNSSVFDRPSATLKSLIDEVKEKLGIPAVRYIGDISDTSTKILLMPGASGGRHQITATSREKPDVVICGEIAEWETAEYVRDAHTKGDRTALIVLGHVESEEPGSAFMAAWLSEKVKGIKSTHVPAGNSLMFA